MDVIYTTDTQTEIDSLFAPSPVQEVEVEEEVKEEPTKPEPVWYTVDKIYMDDLFEAMDEMDTAEMLEESAQVVEEEVITEVPEVVSEVEVEEPKSYMDMLSDTLSYTAKRLDKSSGQLKMTEQEALFDNFQAQLDRMKRTILENTVVSGIGQGGDGQTPGSGVVRAVDLDDVVIDGINQGDTIIWDGNNFVPGLPGTGGGAQTTRQLLLESPSTGNFRAGRAGVILHPNFPLSGDYTTQEDANILFTECLNFLELGKAHIFVDANTPDDGLAQKGDLYVDDSYDLFVFNGQSWVQLNGAPDIPDPDLTGYATEQYVDQQDALRIAKAGDTMNGNLGFKSLTAENYLKINSIRPDGYDGSDLFGLEINLSDGNTYKNQLRVRGRSDKEIVRMWIQDEQKIETNAVLNLKPPANLGGNTSWLVARDVNGATSFSVGANGTVRAGTAGAPFIATDDHHIVTKKFSDERLQDVQNQIDNLEASNLSTTTLNYTYTTGAISDGKFKGDSLTPGSVLSFSFSSKDTANRVLPDINTGDVITTRLATGTAPVQTFKVVDGSNINNVTVTAESTTADSYTNNETYIVTIGHSFDGFATIDYVDTKVAKTGDTMAGPLILSGDPGTGLQAATKNYVDNTVHLNTPNLTDYIKKDGSVAMTGTLNARNIDIGNNASILFSSGSQYIKINDGRTLGIYGYSGSSFTSSYTRNIEVSNGLTEFRTRTNFVSNCISVRPNGYAFEVKPGDVLTRGGWNHDGSLMLFPDRTGTNTAFDIKPAGLDAGSAKSAFRVLGNGKVKAGYNTSNPFMATDDDDVATKAYVDSVTQYAAPKACPATMDFQWRSNRTQNLSNGQFRRASSGSQVNISYKTWSGLTWCDTETLSGDQNMEALFSIYRKEGEDYILKLCLQVQQITFGYRPDSYSIRRFEAKKTYIKMGSYDDLTDYGLYYLTIGGLF